MEGTDVKVLPHGSCAALIDWTELFSLGETKGHLLGKTEVSTVASSLEDLETNERNADSGTTDTYEAFLDLAYTKPENSEDEGNQAEESMEADLDTDEEPDAPQAFPLLPSRTCMVQRLIPRKGWITVYYGSGNQCEIKNFPSDQQSRLRLKIIENDGNSSPWKYFTFNSSGLIYGGRELWEAVSRGNTSNVANVVLEIQKTSQINSLNACVEEGLTHMVTCALRGSKEAFAMMLEAGAGVSVRTGGPQVTPFHGAAWGGHENLIKRMETAGASWETFDRTNLHPIEYAIMNANENIVEGALRSSSDWLKNTRFQKPILSVAVHAHFYHCYAKKKKKPQDNCSDECESDNPEKSLTTIVDKLLHNGSNLNERGPQGGTPLHTALVLGNYKLVNKFVKEGADLSIPNDYGFTPKNLISILDFNPALN